MQKNSSLLISGILSFSFYILLCFLVVYYISSPPVKKYTAKTKVTVLELDVIVEKSDKKRIEKKEDKKIEKKEVVVEKAASKAAEKKPDLKSLFANVSTKSAKVAKKEVNKVVKSIDPKKFKSKFEKQKKSSNVKLDKLLNDKKTTTNVSSSSKSKSKESDEYFSQVSSLLDVWIPLIREDGLQATVLVMIDTNGRFDYKFKKYSGNNDFDISLKAFLEEQKSIIYPKPKKRKKVQIDVDFKSKG
ncbi:TonB C-terminal domain-containing protein [Poseidonibacter lekithochrous]|uniref:TonB C-terminal domain-containing protein n=1 Tax=Poseidonibacter TaxID=2321187 RepID=UPI001C084A80|nr:MULTISPECIES: TonB C-terminal domain-containing protein [Poseidonibacter]MBU3015732.1 TonB C-terminal domain-containing protein [Poseidonibacter lekithochrous]MDO6829032.1 TonB C-terminal domain-containing protein [Poseidonibacter sp. 1_MG-2023]